MAGRHLRTHTLTAALATLAVLATGCAAEDDDSPHADATEQSDEETDDGHETDGGDTDASSAAPATGTVEVTETVAEDLPSPWGLVEAPDGSLLLASRDEATIARIDPESGNRTELASIDGVDTNGEAGLLGLALDDDGDWLYAYYTAESDNRVIRMAYGEDSNSNELGTPEVVLNGIPKDPVVHHGGGLAFGPDDMLYASTGDADEPDLAQDEDSLAGKVLRMTPEGEVPEDNPTDGSYVWSLGHRNVQGLAWDGEDRLWATEFGADELDEVNLIEPGGNYGWPEHEGSGGEDEGYLDPEVEWPVEEASPSGLAYAEGSLWMAGLRGERLWRIPLDEEGSAGEPQDFLEEEYGRLRSVVAVGDGELLLATNETDTRGTPEENDDRILRLDVS